MDQAFSNHYQCRCTIASTLLRGLCPLPSSSSTAKGNLPLSLAKLAPLGQNGWSASVAPAWPPPLVGTTTSCSSHPAAPHHAAMAHNPGGHDHVMSPGPSLLGTTPMSPPPARRSMARCTGFGRSGPGDAGSTLIIVAGHPVSRSAGGRRGMASCGAVGAPVEMALEGRRATLLLTVQFSSSIVGKETKDRVHLSKL